jgi:two-component system CheB/CheR fusion protein
LQNYKNFIEDIHQVVCSETVLEKEVVLSNGSPNLMKIMPYIRLDKKVDGVIITFIDISNIKERTEALKRMNLELEASNNELLQFASVASHDLKEPLRKIHLFGSMLRDQHLDKMSGEAYSYIDRVIAASSRMTKLVNDLLSFTRLSGESIFEINDLNVIVKEVISDLELSIAEKNATIEVADLPDMEMVPAQMRQVFQNLISNALKFSRPGVLPHIKIAAERVSQLTFIDGHDQHGQYCRITIKDNGIGFDEEYADRIFTIFQRLHNSEKYEGTGIGLAITKKIIEKHNGIIRAKSREGKGASFSFVVPLRHKEAKNARQTRVGWRMSDV